MHLGKTKTRNEVKSFQKKANIKSDGRNKTYEKNSYSYSIHQSFYVSKDGHFSQNILQISKGYRRTCSNHHGDMVYFMCAYKMSA